MYIYTAIYKATSHSNQPTQYTPLLHNNLIATLRRSRVHTPLQTRVREIVAALHKHLNGNGAQIVQQSAAAFCWQTRDLR